MINSHYYSIIICFNYIPENIFLPIPPIVFSHEDLVRNVPYSVFDLRLN